MVTEVIERMARAMEPLAWAALGVCDTKVFTVKRDASLSKARAALEALLDPTEEMLDGPARAVLIADRFAATGHKRPKAAVLTDIFTAMIRTALGDGK